MEPVRELQRGMGPQAEFFFARGMDSFTDPTFVGARQYCSAFNTIHRGGAVQCRPGYLPLSVLSAGRLQGIKLFTPTRGVPHLVFAIDGAIYASKAPFTSYFQIPELSFRKGVRNIFFADTIKSVRRNTTNGELTVCDPYRVLVIQDGNYTRAGYWDGANAAHVDPSPTGNKETVGGGIMAWSGDRLWVARGPQLFAGDIADPLSFDENDYLAEGQPLLFPSDITAMVEVPSATNPSLLVFTKDRGYLVRSDIRDRTAWKTTPDFQVVFTSAGCVGHRAVTVQHGLVWWYSAGGLLSLDSGALSNTSSQISYRDIEMAISKANISCYTHRVALTAVENFLLVSVPSGDGYNRHTWVLDQSAADLADSDLSASWAGIWVGTRPVEWAVGEVNGRTRAFFLSVDTDGQNRLWEAFQPTQKDGGKAITWSMTTKAHAGDGLHPAVFRYAELYLAQVKGTVSMEISYAGAYRGEWKTLASPVFRAATATLSADTPLGADTPIRRLRPQTRLIRTPDASATPGNSTVEGPTTENVDFSHQLRLVVSGPAALRGYQMYFKPHPQSASGASTPLETAATGIDVAGAAVSEDLLIADTDAQGGAFLSQPLELRAQDLVYSSV